MTAPIDTLYLDSPLWLIEHVMHATGFETHRAARRWLRDAGVPVLKVGKRIVIRREALLGRLAELEASA